MLRTASCGPALSPRLSSLVATGKDVSLVFKTPLLLILLRCCSERSFNVVGRVYDDYQYEMI
jgi:hypothetical protein